MSRSTPALTPARRHHRRLWLAALPLVALAAGGAYLALPAASAPAQPAAVAAPKVTVAPVEQQLVTEFEELTGHVEATETVELRARVSGHLDAVHFAAGQLVNKGDVLFTIDPRWYQAQFDLAAARAELAANEARRAEQLLSTAALSDEEAESRRTRALEARAQLDTARLDLEHTQIRAPISGRIGRALVTPGNLVAGNPGAATLLATIVATGDAYVYADVDETTLLRFNRLARERRLLTRDGRIPVELQLADETGFQRQGYLESADNRVNPATGSLVLRLVFPNTDQALLPGLFARVRLPVGAPQPALLVSERAIGTDQSQKFVLVVDAHHTVAYRSVRLGAAVGGKRVVREGVQAGDTIIVNGLQRVRPGMVVAPEFQTAATAESAAGPFVATLR